MIIKKEGDMISKMFDLSRLKVSRHALNRCWDRLGEKYVKGRKIKNMGRPDLEKYILNHVENNYIRIVKKGLFKRKVVTEEFVAVIEDNVIVTIYSTQEKHIHPEPSKHLTYSLGCYFS